MTDSSEVRALLLQINANTELLRSNLSEAEKAVAAFHSSTQQHLDDSDKRFEALGKSIEKLEKPLESLKRAGEFAVAALLGESLVEKGKQALEFAGNIQFMANQIGVSTDFLQKFNYAAGQYGVATEVADTGLTRFTRTIGEAANGNKEAISLFDRLGVKIRDAGGTVRSVTAIYGDFANGIQKIDSPTQRVADTMSAFGRGAAGLTPLLQSGAAGFNDLAAAAQALGIVLSPELIEHSEEVNHKLAAMKQIVDAEMASVIATNATAIEGLATALVHAAGAVANFINSHPQEAAALLGAMAGARLGGIPGALAGAAVGAGLGSGEVGAQIEGSNNIRKRVADTKAPAWLGTIPFFPQIMQAAGAVAPLFYSKQGLIDAAGPRPQERKESHDGGLGSTAPGVTNDNGDALKAARSQLTDLEHAKVGASGAALTAINGEIAERQREISFLKQGVPAELAKSLATKEGAALTKAGNDARRAANKAEEERRKALQDDLAYRAEELRLQKSILEGARSSAGNDAQRDALQKAIINEEADTLKATIADKLAKGGYGADAKGKPTDEARARATHLDQLNEQNRQQGVANVDLARLVTNQKDAVNRASLQLQGQVELLGLDDRLAVTRTERLKVELQLLAYQEQQAKAAQQAIIDSKDPKVTEADRDQAKTRIGQIDAQHGRNTQLVERQNADPLQAYGLQLRQNVGDMNDALKGVEVDGLKNLEDGLVGLVSGTETVASAFKKMATSIIADLARILIEKEIVSLIPGLGLKDGGKVPGFADGGINGPVRGPGGPRSDSILARLSNGEYVINAASAAKHFALIEAINRDRLPRYAEGGSIGDIRMPTIASADLRSERRGEVVHRVVLSPNENFDMRVSTVATGAAINLAPAIIQTSKSTTMKALGRRGMPMGGTG